MRGRALALCIAGVAAFLVAAPSIAEAAPCADHLFAVFAQSPPSSIPKTRRVRRVRKARATVAQSRSADAKPQDLRLTTSVGVRAEERPRSGDVIDELELEAFWFDLVLDEPRRSATRELRPILGVLAVLDSSEPEHVVPREGVRQRAALLRTRLLPKIPDGPSDARLVG